MFYLKAMLRMNCSRKDKIQRVNQVLTEVNKF
jgi:hypothetical protein